METNLNIVRDAIILLTDERVDETTSFRLINGLNDALRIKKSMDSSLYGFNDCMDIFLCCACCLCWGVFL